MIPELQPAVDVLMPFRNRQQYLVSAARSVLEQSYPRVRLILGDNGSTDGSERMAHELAADPRVSLVGCEGLSLPGVRNRLLQEASADLIAWLDSDDLANPRRIELQVRYLTNNAECVAVGSDYVAIDEDGDPIAVHRLPETHEEIERALLQRRGIGVLFPGSMMRRPTLLDIGGFREDYPVAEDVDLLLRLAEVGRLANVPEPLTQYRWHLDNLSWTIPSRQQERVRVAVADACRRRGLQCVERAAPPLVREPSASQVRIAWATAAFDAGNLGTARKHALRALRSNPREPRAWRLLALAMFPIPEDGDSPESIARRVLVSPVRRIMFMTASVLERQQNG